MENLSYEEMISILLEVREVRIATRIVPNKTSYVKTSKKAAREILDHHAASDTFYARVSCDVLYLGTTEAL